MLFQWYFHYLLHLLINWTLFSYISLVVLPLSIVLLCLLSAALFRRRRKYDAVSLPSTQHNEDVETASSSSAVSSLEDDEGGGGGGSNEKGEILICALCASRLVVSGSNRPWNPAAATGDGRERGDFVVSVDSSYSGNETGEEKKAAIDEVRSRKKVEFAVPAGLNEIRQGKSRASASSAAMINEVEPCPKQELVIRISTSSVPSRSIGTGTAMITDQETNPNEEVSSVDEFFSCDSIPVVTGGSGPGVSIGLVRLSTGEGGEGEGEGTCSKLLKAISDEDDDEEEEETEEEEEEGVVKPTSLAPVRVSGGEEKAAIVEGTSSSKGAVPVREV